eukprot:6209210-Pleurochrysis_carterae.AAC.2
MPTLLMILLSAQLRSTAAADASTEELKSEIQELRLRLQALEHHDQETMLSIDTFWLISSGIFIFFMQLGFTMFEAGSVRAKNRMNILLKNLLDSCVGAVMYYFFGFSLQVPVRHVAYLVSTLARFPRSSLHSCKARPLVRALHLASCESPDTA